MAEQNNQKTIESLEKRIAELEAEKAIGIKIVACETFGLKVQGACKNELDKVADLVNEGSPIADRFLTLMCGKINHSKNTNTGIAKLTSGQVTDLRNRAGYIESTNGVKSTTYKMR